MPGNKITAPIERFFSKIAFEPMSGCWLWTGCVAPNGYGLAIGMDRKLGGAHRLAYTFFVAPIPKSFHVHHKCGNK